MLLTETSPNWIELHNDLHFLEEAAGVRLELAALRLQASLSVRSRRQAAASAHRRRVDGRRRRRRERAGRRRREARQRVLPGERSLAARASALRRHRSTRARREAPQRISREAGWHDAKLLPGARGYLDLWSSPEQPPTASLRKLDGSLQHWLVRNALDETHPYHAVPRRSRQGRVRLDRGERRPAAVLSPDEARGTAARQALSGRRRRLRRSAQPVRAARTGWAAHARARLLPPDARAARLRRVHARQSRLGFPRRRVRNRARAALRQGRDRGSAARRRVPEDAGVRRSAAHRHHGLELRRLHDADGADDDRCVQSRRRGRAGHRLAALRHALHRALSRHAERQRERLRSERQCCRTSAR